MTVLEGKMTRKFFAAVVKAFDDKTLTIEHFISTEIQDRSGDIVRAEGMQLDGVPSVLKQHGMDPDMGAEPIAKCIELRVGKLADGTKGIIAKTQYYPDEVGRRLYEKAKGGYMPYWSIGFDIEAAQPISGGGRDIRKWWLYEYSQVGVPDNVTAETIKSFNPESDPKISYDGRVEKADLPPATILSRPATELKLLVERMAGRVPMQALYSVHEEFCAALAWACPTEKDVRALVKEYVALVTGYAETFWAEVHALDDAGKTATIAAVKALFAPDLKTTEATTRPTGQVDEAQQAAPAPAAAAVPAPQPPSAPTAETVPPAGNAAAAQPAPAPEPVAATVPAPAPPAAQQGTPIRLALGSAAASTPSTVKLGDGITPASIAAASASAVRAEFATALGRLPE